MAKPSVACDMWSYVCLFAELYLDFEPFHGWANGGVVTTMVEILGPLSEKWKGSCVFKESRDDWYDPIPNSGVTLFPGLLNTGVLSLTLLSDSMYCLSCKEDSVIALRKGGLQHSFCKILDSELS